MCFLFIYKYENRRSQRIFKCIIKIIYRKLKFNFIKRKCCIFNQSIEVHLHTEIAQSSKHLKINTIRQIKGKKNEIHNNIIK